MRHTEESATLLKALRQAFPVDPIPKNIAGQESSYEDECAYVAEYFTDRPWTDVTLKGLLEEYRGPPDACLHFMSAEGFQYYLPAYISIFLRQYEEADIVSDAAVYALCPIGDKAMLEWLTSRFILFDKAQRHVILEFLRYVSRYHGAEHAHYGLPEAIEYWERAT